MEIEEENKAYKVLKTKRDYILLESTQQNIEIRYFELPLSYKLLQQNNISKLKVCPKSQTKQKFNSLMQLIVLILKQYTIEELILDFSNFFNMEDEDLKTLMFTLQQNLNQFSLLEINLDFWAENNELITDLGCQYIGSLFQQQNSMHTLKMSFMKWGLNNNRINDQAVKNITEGILNCKELNSLDLNFQTWGCKKYSTLGYISNLSVGYISNMLQKLTLLTDLNLNLRSWGYSNPKITNKSLINLGTALKQLNSLQTLSINLYCWGYENCQVNDTGLKFLLNQISQHQKTLKKLDLNLDGWSSDFKNECSLQTVSDDVTNYLFQSCINLYSLEIFNINLSSWGWKNNKISDQSLESVGNFLLERGNFLKELDINFKVWWNDHSQISGLGIQNLCLGLLNCENLLKLDLNLESMGYKNRNLNSDSINQIGLSLQKFRCLKSLNLNLECWGVEDTQTYGFIGDQEITNLIQPIQNMGQLTSLSLNLNSWGYKNNKITDKSIQIIGETIVKHSQYLQTLNLQLRYWGYNNSQITNASLQSLAKCINQLKELKHLNIDIDSWGDGNDKINYFELSYLLSNILDKKYLKNFVFDHALDDWFEGMDQGREKKTQLDKFRCKNLLQLIQYKIDAIDNLVLGQGTLQQQYSHIFRKELIYDICELMVN